MAKFTIKPETLDAIRARDPNELFIDKFRFCGACGDSTIDKLLQCSSCRVIYYCNRECQRKDWPQHKNSCQHYKQQKPIIETLSKYCKSLNRSRLETFNDCETIGAFLFISDVQEFLKLDDKHAFNMIIDESDESDGVLPYTYVAYGEFDKFATSYRMMMMNNSNLQMYSDTVSAFKRCVNLGWFMLVIYAPELAFYYCKEIN